MEYRKLGESGLSVSVICLGTMMFGGLVSKATARRMIDLGRDAGMNFIDTAEAYGAGAAEAVLGDLLRRDRDSWVLASKVGSLRAPPPGHRSLNRKWIFQAIDASLSRLRSDYVDIYYCHRDDPETPLEETIGAMGDVIRQGKARYWGFSNYTGWRVGELIRLSDKLGVPRPVVCQPYYSAVGRTAENDLFPACGHYGIGVVPYSTIARGVLVGKYQAGKPVPKGSRAARKDERILESEMREESFRIAQTLKAHAERRAMSPVQFAFNWALNNALVSAAIAGPRTIGQWRDYLGAVKHRFTVDDEALVEGLVPAGHTSTPGFTDPKHPVMGRVARSAAT